MTLWQLSSSVKGDGAYDYRVIWTEKEVMTPHQHFRWLLGPRTACEGNHGNSWSCSTSHLTKPQDLGTKGRRRKKKVQNVFVVISINDLFNNFNFRPSFFLCRPVKTQKNDFRQYSIVLINSGWDSLVPTDHFSLLSSIIVFKKIFDVKDHYKE